MHIDDKIAEKAKDDGSYAVAYAILELARAQRETAIAIKNFDIAHLAERTDVGLNAIADAIGQR